MDCGVNFVRTGNPNGDYANLTDTVYPLWGRFNDAPEKVYEFGEHVGMVDMPDLELFRLLDEYQLTLK